MAWHRRTDRRGARQHHIQAVREFAVSHHLYSLRSGSEPSVASLRLRPARTASRGHGPHPDPSFRRNGCRRPCFGSHQEFGASERPLRDVVRGYLEEGLRRLGVAYRFPPMGEIANTKELLVHMMSIFTEYPDHELLVTIDELLECLDQTVSDCSGGAETHPPPERRTHVRTRIFGLCPPIAAANGGGPAWLGCQPQRGASM